MKKLSMIVLVLLAMTSAAFALDDRGNPNDPRVNERANACYEDGTLAGRCQTQWDWDAGWYLIRFQFGLISRANFPHEYISVLPPEEIRPGGSNPPSGPINGPAPAGCYYTPVYDLYYYWSGSPSMPSIALSWDTGCTSMHTGVGGFYVLSEADTTSATTVCNTAGYGPALDFVPSSETGAWPIFRCQIP